jgi:DNA-binding response OmpR family regulator
MEMGEQDAILIIDHDPDAALLLSDFLEREGYAVAVAAPVSTGSG